VDSKIAGLNSPLCPAFLIFLFLRCCSGEEKVYNNLMKQGEQFLKPPTKIN
jgi:hypothetical protein